MTAARMVGLRTVPCIIYPTLAGQQELSISLVENLGHIHICLRIARKLIPEAREACHRGTITQQDAYQLSGMSQDDQRRVYLKEGDLGVKRPGRGIQEGETERCLRQALTFYKKGDRRLALACAEKAVEALRGTLKLHAVPMG